MTKYTKMLIGAGLAGLVGWQLVKRNREAQVDELMSASYGVGPENPGDWDEWINRTAGEDIL